MQTTDDLSRSDHTNLRIAYLNVRGLSQNKLQMTEHWMHQQEYDILFLSETWFSQELSYTASPYFFCSSLRPPMNPKAIRSTCGIITLCQPQLHSIISPQTTQYSITLKIADQTISGMYLPPSLPLADFKSALENIPTSTTLLGDLNCIISSCDDKTSTLKQYCTTRNLYHVSHPEARLDHIWINNSIIPHSITYIPRETLNISDHGLIGITIPLCHHKPKYHANPTRRYFLKHLRDERKCNQLRQHYERFTPLIDQVIAQASENTNGKTFKDVIKWVDAVDEIWTFSIHEACTKILGTYLVDDAKHWNDRSLEELAKSNSFTSSTRLWKRSQRGRQARLVSSPEFSSPLEEGIHLFKSVYADDSHDPRKTPHRANTTQIMQPDAGLSAEFTVQRLKRVIRQYPKHKSCGPDGLHARIFAVMSDSGIFMTHFTKLCLFYASVSCTPTSWNTSNTPLLPKQAGDTCMVTNTRPVSLTNMARRYFESLLLRHLIKQPSFNLHENQAGFRHGYSTISHLLVAHESCRLPRSQRHSVSIYLDLMKAFDRVQHAPLLEELRSRGCTESTIFLLYHLMMHECKSHIIVNGMRSETILRRRGVFQGSILAPLLFNIVMDALAIDLSRIPNPDHYPWFLFFADDIRLSTMPSNTETLHQALRYSEAWAKRFGLSFGIPKCGVIGGDQLSFHLNNIPIPHVTQYKYLGVEFNSGGIAWSDFHARVLNKADGTLRLLFKCATKEWGHATRLALIKTFVLSQLQYGLGMMAHHDSITHRLGTARQIDLSKLRTLHTNCLDFVFGFSTTTPLLESMTNINNVDDALTLAKATTSRHLNNLAQKNPYRTALKFIRESPNFFLTYTSRSLLIKTYTDAHFLKWRKEVELQKAADPEKITITLKRFLMNIFHHQRLLSSTLSTYISSECRTTTGRIDLTLFIKDPELRNNAILWRTNRFTIKRFCEVCCKDSTRTHVNECRGTDESRIIEPHDLQSFHSEQQKRRRRFGVHDNYTILDHLLNKQNLEKFHALAKSLLDNSSR